MRKFNPAYLLSCALFVAASSPVFAGAAEQAFPSKVRLKVLKQGAGAVPTLNSTVELHYRVFRDDGTEADSSVKRGGPAKRVLKDTMPCFKEALVHVREGATVALFCPATSLAAPGGPDVAADLKMEVQLLKVFP